MIPAGAVLRRLPDIGVAFTGGDGALRQRRDAVHLVSKKLPHTVEVYSRAVVLHAVRDMDFDGVAPVGLNCWTRELSVDQEDGPFDAIGGSGGIDNIKVILSHDASVRGGIVVISIDVVCLWEMSLIDWLRGVSAP